MSRCFPFPPAGYRVKTERYEELIDAIKVLKEKLNKEKKKGKGKERREKRNERSKQKKNDDADVCDDTVVRHLQLAREDERETKQFERSCSLNDGDEDGDERATSSYDSTGSNDNETKTKKRKLCTSQSSSSSRCSNITEESEYKYLQLIQNQGVYDINVDAANATTLPPVNLDWLYPGTRTTTTTTSKEDKRRGAEKTRTGSLPLSCGSGNSNMSCSWSRAQYLHQIDAFALPFVVPF